MLRRVANLALFLTVFLAPALNAQPPRLDAFDDPLPAGAIHRLGSLRQRPIGWWHQLALSPDGKRLVTSSGKGLQFWDPDTGKLVRSWNVQGGHLAFSPDGNWLAIGSKYYEFHLRDAHSGKLKHTLSKWGGPVAYSPDGKTLACAVGGHQLLLYDVATGKMTHYLGAFSAVCLAFSPDSRYLAAGSGTDSPHDTVYANVWDVTTGKRVCSVKQPGASGSLQGVAFLPDSKQFFVSSIQLTLHDVATGKLVRIVAEKGIGTLACDRVGKRMFSSAGEIWDLEKLNVIRRVAPVHHREIAISADGTRAASSYPLRVWDVATGKALFAPPGQGFNIDHVAFAPDDRRIVTMSEYESSLRIWDARTGAHLESLGARRPTNQHHMRGPMRFADNPNRLIVGWELWDLKAKERLPTLYDLRPPKPIELPFYSITISPDGKLAVDFDERKGVRFWEVNTCRLIRSVALPPSTQYGAAHYAFTADGKTLAVTHYNGEPIGDKPTMFFIDVASAKITRRLRAGAEMAGFPQFSQDGRWLILNRREVGLEVWHVASGLRFREIVEPKMPTHYPAFALAPHGQLLATCSDDHDVVLYETASGQRIVTLKGHEDRIARIAFSNDGRRLVSASEDRTALVWSLDLLGQLPDSDEDGLWRDLSGDAPKAYPILWALARSPKQAIALVQKRVQSDPAADEKTLNRLIADLGSAVFLKRRDAMEALRALGSAALPALQAELERPSEVEVRRRIEELLRRLNTEPPPAELLRDLRIVQMLEMIGTEEARAILEGVAKASRLGPRAIAAQSALARLDCRLRLSVRGL